MRQPSLRAQVIYWAECEHYAVAAEELAAERSPRRFHQRAALLAAARHRRSRADRARSRLSEGALDTLVSDLLVEAWEDEAATLGTHRHPFHPGLDAQREQRLPDILARLRAEPLRDDWPSTHEISPAAVPGLPERLTIDFASRALQQAAAHVRGVADSDTFLVERLPSGVMIQHQASGLRATFTRRLDGLGFVDSKPYNIASIDPDRPGLDVDWEPYVGLGIGTRIYRRAAELLPDIRWTSQASTDYAVGLRIKLHTDDPYRWEGPCRWCTARQYDWRHARREDFDRHP